MKSTFYPRLCFLLLGLLPFATAKVDISGHVRTYDNENIEGVVVTLTGPGVSMNTQTDVNGDYLFSGVPENQTYTVCVDHDIDPLNGVSTFDLVLTDKHMQFVQLFDTPHKIICADATGDDLVDVADIMTMRMLILGVITTYPSGVPSWRFVPADWVPDPLNPFPLPLPLQCKEIIVGSSNFTGVDFIGDKTGDVNGSAVPY